MGRGEIASENLVSLFGVKHPSNGVVGGRVGEQGHGDPGVRFANESLEGRLEGLHAFRGVEIVRRLNTGSFLDVRSEQRKEKGGDFGSLEGDFQRVCEGHVLFFVSVVDKEKDLLIVFVVADNVLVRSGHGDVVLVNVRRYKKRKKERVRSVS